MSIELRFYEQNCIVKCVIFFASFCWLWDFLLENLKLRKKRCQLERLVMSIGTSGQIKKRCMAEVIFSKAKKKFQIWDFESLIFWSSFHFWGFALGRYSQYIFSHHGSPSALKICCKFRGEHPCRSTISIKWNHTSTWVFSCKYSAYFQNSFS